MSATSTPDIVVEGRWTSWKDFTQDHTRFLVMLPGYLGAYIIPGFALSPVTIECVMNTMNTTCPGNTCPYCTGLHGQLLRLCGSGGGADGTITISPPVAYAKAFCLARATTSGGGGGGNNDVETAKEYAKLVDAIGTMKAYSVQALCWALVWGQATGNSINAARDKLRAGAASDGSGAAAASFSLLDLFLLVWYGPLFAVIGVLNALLTVIPGSFPSLVSTMLGALLWLPQALFIAPIGLASLVRHGGRLRK